MEPELCKNMLRNLCKKNSEQNFLQLHVAGKIARLDDAFSEFLVSSASQRRHLWKSIKNWVSSSCRVNNDVIQGFTEVSIR